MYECDKCGSDKVKVIKPDVTATQKIKMSEVSSVQAVPLVYNLTTLRCKDCNFEVQF